MEDLLDLILFCAYYLVFLLAVEQPVDGDTGDGRIVGLSNLLYMIVTLYFSLQTSLTMRMSVSSKS